MSIDDDYEEKLRSILCQSQTPHVPYGVPDDPSYELNLSRLVREIARAFQPSTDWSRRARQTAERLLELLQKALEAPSGLEILDEVARVTSTLLEKNRQYGDSALEPLGWLSDASAAKQIDIRLEDKLKRLRNDVDDPEDVFLDIVGYIILRRIAARRESEGSK